MLVRVHVIGLGADASAALRSCWLRSARLVCRVDGPNPAGPCMMRKGRERKESGESHKCEEPQGGRGRAVEGDGREGKGSDAMQWRTKEERRKGRRESWVGHGSTPSMHILHHIVASNPLHSYLFNLLNNLLTGGSMATRRSAPVGIESPFFLSHSQRTRPDHAAAAAPVTAQVDRRGREGRGRGADEDGRAAKSQATTADAATTVNACCACCHACAGVRQARRIGLECRCVGRTRVRRAHAHAHAHARR